MEARDIGQAAASLPSTAQLKQACYFLLEGRSVPDRYLKPIARLALERLRQEARDADPNPRA
jgi:hypothetical protein